jgi:diguanylate cyclase (GGDEF)-like protein
MAQSIETLGSKEISRLLVRHRRGETLERYQPQLDAILREILSKANAFVPSECGAILLDDPKAKIFDPASNRLTVIAALGPQPERLLGQRLPVDQGLAGRVYTSGAAVHQDGIGAEEEPLQQCYEGLRVRSMLGVPVLLGNSICGVILLINRSGRESFSDENNHLLEVFAAYISSSIQNTIDGLRAKELAQRDDLTGLYNDRYLHYRLRSEIRRAAADKGDLALLFIDLDCFKSINDRYGHLEGSRTLHMVGILLGSAAPPDAVAARYGGDEFVIILPGATAARASEVAEALRSEVAQTTFRADGAASERFAVTASVGVASLTEHVRPGGRSTERANQLIRLADAAMYRAKADGKDRVSVVTTEEE